MNRVWRTAAALVVFGCIVGAARTAIAPFYWHFTDSAKQSELTVVIPFSWSHEPGAHSFAFWPLFYASNKFGWAIPILLTFNVGDSKIGNQYGAFVGLYWWKRSQK